MASELPKKLTVELTQVDISLGTQADCLKCPLSLAINRALPSEYFVAVFDDEIRVHTLDGSVVGHYSHTSKTKAFIEIFDQNHNDIEPFTFELELIAYGS